MKFFTLASIFITLILLPGNLFAQFDDKINEAIDQMIADHPLRFGIFRVRPEVQVGSGYDSNVFLNSELPLSDYYVSVGPGADFGLKLGRKAFLTILEQVTFLHYQDFEELNDIFNTTSASFVTGNRRMLLRLSGFWIKKKAPINVEFDIPAEQESISGTLDFSFAITSKTDLSFSFSSTRNVFARDPDIVYELPIPPDNHVTAFSAGFEQLLGKRITAGVHYSSGETEFLNSQEINPSPTHGFWNVMSGLHFRSRKISGQALAGFGQTEGARPGEELKDFLIDTDFDYSFGRRASVGVQIKRQRYVSALLRNNFRLTTEGGPRASMPLTKRFFLDGEFLVGKNDYGEDFRLGDQPVNKDDYRRLTAGFNTFLTKMMILRAGITRLDRESDSPLLNKDRFTFNLSIIISSDESSTGN